MNKIYNNLSIENLQKTEWFYQFDINQKKEILDGLKNNIDVSVYAKIEFDSQQMYQIRKGLEANLDVSVYAKPEYSSKEMRDIRLELLEESTL